MRLAIPTRTRRSKKNARPFGRMHQLRSHHEKSKVREEPVDKSRLNFILLDKNRGGVPLKIKKIYNASSAKGVALKTSESWIKTQDTLRVPVSLPYIDRFGKFTGAEVFEHYLSPQGFISTVIATVFRRIKLLTQRRNGIKDTNIMQNLLLKASAYYSLTKNSYFWDRFLFLSKNIRQNQKAIRGLIYSVTSKLDDYKWFVYGHVCLQTQWLTSRALRPRDKSAYIDSDENFTVSPALRCKRGRIQKFTLKAVWKCFGSIHNLY